MEDGLSNPATGRLSIQKVERPVDRRDVCVEEMIVRFIADRYGAKNQLYLPPQVAKEILKRPADFIQAAKNYCAPELKF